MKEIELTKEEQNILLKIARDSIRTYLEKKKKYKCDCTEEKLQQKCGAFVSLHTGERLRGCIGTFVADTPLCETVANMAFESAFHDPRFPPLTMRELPDIEIEISVLSPLKKIKNIEEIEVGKHGLYITKNFYKGVLLPQVATKYGWGREKFLMETCVKAGLPTDAWRKGATIQIFTAQIFSETSERKE